MGLVGDVVAAMVHGSGREVVGSSPSFTAEAGPTGLTRHCWRPRALIHAHPVLPEGRV